MLRKINLTAVPMREGCVRISVEEAVYQVHYLVETELFFKNTYYKLEELQQSKSKELAIFVIGFVETGLPLNIYLKLY